MQTSTPTHKTRSKRGAPRGNTNALKHGFYAVKYRPKEFKDLEKHDFDGLTDEITMLRVFIRRVIELSEQAENLSETTDLLRVLSLATTSLTRLLKTQHLLYGSTNTFQAYLQEILGDVHQELKIENPQ